MEAQELKIKKIISIIIINILVFSTISMTCGMIQNKLVEKGLISKNSSVSNENKVDINWKEIYPFEEKINVTNQADNVNISNKGIYKKIIEKIKGKIKEIEDSDAYIMFNQQLLELSGYMDRILGKNEIPSKNVVKLTNEELYGPKPKESQDESAKNITEFNNWLKSKNIPFFYIEHPVKVSKYNNLLPTGILDYSNENMDELQSKLEKNNVETIDLRELMHNQGINQYDFFYKTDHHWNVEAGIWAAGAISKVLNSKLNYSLDTEITSIERYEKKIYENSFLGSYGIKVTRGYCVPENFTIYIPKFTTNLRIVHKDIEFDKTDSFENVVFDYNRLNSKDYYNSNRYASMLYGNRPLTQITNNLSENNVRVLFIRDSFSLAMAPYFSLMVSQTDLIDVRESNGNFNGSVKKYIEKTKPDVVILLYNSAEYEYK